MAKSNEKASTVENVAAAAPSPHDMMSVRLFKDSGRYSDDVTVGVNGKIVKIQRGVEVKVPRYIYDVLEASNNQDIATANLITQEENSYRAAAKYIE